MIYLAFYTPHLVFFVRVLPRGVRETDLEGKAKALRERLASTLEGSMVD